MNTASTRQSNGLAWPTHSTILSSPQTGLAQAELLDDLWHFAIRNVTKCETFITHSVTKKVPYEVVFHRKVAETLPLRPFGCKALDCPVLNELPT